MNPLAYLSHQLVLFILLYENKTQVAGTDLVSEILGVFQPVQDHTDFFLKVKFYLTNREILQFIRNPKKRGFGG